MPKAWAYVRVSTVDQALHGHSLDNQALTCKEHWKARLITEYEWGGVFVDKAVSGKMRFADRPMGAKLLEAVRPGDVVIVNELSRAFRNTADFLNTVAAWQKQDVKFLAIKMGMDTGTPYGRFMLSMFAVVYEFQREMIVERTREVVARKKAAGEWTAGQAPFGFKKVRANGKSKLVPHPPDRELGNLVVRLRAERGMTWEQMHREFRRLNVTRGGRIPSPAAMQRLFKLETSLRAMEADAAERGETVTGAMVRVRNESARAALTSGAAGDTGGNNDVR